MIVLMCVCVIVRAVRCSILLPAWFLTTTLWCEEGWRVYTRIRAYYVVRGLQLNIM